MVVIAGILFVLVCLAASTVFHYVAEVHYGMTLLERNVIMLWVCLVALAIYFGLVL